jgi:hypothetical protein
LVSGNKVKERKAQADAALYRTMAAKIVEKWPNLKDNIAGQARAVANELGLPKEKLRSIRRMLSQK